MAALSPMGVPQEKFILVLIFLSYLSFNYILLQHVKINQKHNLLVRELSDLINQPSPSSSHHSVDNSRMVIREKVNDRSMQSFESKLAGTCMCPCTL